MDEPLVEILSEDELEEKKQEFLALLKKSNIVEIEADTREQTSSQVRYRERRLRLTASRFGQICKI